MVTKKKVNKKQTTTIRQYIKKRKNKHITVVGIMVGNIDSEGIVRIGWSRAAINKGDKFNKEYGLKLATQRLGAKETVPVPSSIENDMGMFQVRCARYFKDAKGFAKIPVQSLSSLHFLNLPYSD